jgi:hypothetical protein
MTLCTGMVAECIYTGNAILSFYQDILNTVHCENDVKLVRSLRASSKRCWTTYCEKGKDGQNHLSIVFNQEMVALFYKLWNYSDFRL